MTRKKHYTFVALVAVGLLFTIHTYTWHGSSLENSGTFPSLFQGYAPSTDIWNPLHFVRGSPAVSFRDNLLPEFNYVSAWIIGGFTNEVMELANLVHLAKISDRVAVLPPFPVSRYTKSWEIIGIITFSDVFDISHLRQSLQIPVIEWKDLKISGSQLGGKPHFDKQNCWSLWAPYDKNSHPRGNKVLRNVSLDVSYTPIQNEVKLTPISDTRDKHSSFWSLARLSFPSGYSSAIKLNKPIVATSPPPDKHFMCFDSLYYVSALKPYEWEEDYSPGWRTASFFRWKPDLILMAQEYIEHLLNISSSSITPPYISVHIRRSDFSSHCGKTPLEECFPPLLAYAKRVQEIQDELANSTPSLPESLPVIVTSDEKDPAWWDLVREQGWLYVNHGADGENTTERFSEWHILLIDVVIQSLGRGFVGTDRSTMSTLARRRVEDWGGGKTRMVKWGKMGADDH